MTDLSSTLLPWYRRFRHGAAPAEFDFSTIHGVVSEALRREPRRTLLADEQRHLGNAQLLNAIAVRARLLLAHCGEPGATVAVRLDNDLELAVTYFACLEAGLPYLPLPAAPASVTSRLLAILAPRLLVTSAAADPSIGGVETLHVDGDPGAAPDVPLPPPDPGRPAHVLLTSGTETGRPKAVVTDHVGSLLSHAWRSRSWPHDKRHDVVGCNIFGVWDLVPALAHGVPAVMLSDVTLRDPFALADAVIRYGITRLMLTPTLLDACLACPDAVRALTRLRHLTLCGEVVTAPLMEQAWEILAGVAITNLYSLSECHDVAGSTLRAGYSISSGVVADFADVHVVAPDDRRRLTAVDEPGRILIGGQALAHGYLDEATTAARFLEVTTETDVGLGRVYDTGDLGRLNADGTLTVLGRVDTKVKVRGAWADPEAVTAELLQHRFVARAVTAAEPDSNGRIRLRSFVVPAAGAPEDLPRCLRADLAAVLPPQSVPASIELKEQLPLLASGKIDLSRLQLEGQEPVQPAEPALREADALERQILAAFRETLDRPHAAPGDSFDDLGGDSLKAIALCGHIQTVTGRPLRIRDLHRHPTPAALAGFLAQRPSRLLADRVPLPMDRLPPAAPPRTAPVQTLLLTGATGAIGSALLPRLLADVDAHIIALVRAGDDRHAEIRLTSALPDDTPTAHLTALAGDLGHPRLGFVPDIYDELLNRIDAVVHLGARLDMFAAYETLAAANVAGTRALLELALASGAAFHHLSSSAVLPLESRAEWDESRYGRALLEALAPRLVHSDGYSQTKLTAETLVWQAAERGLRVAVTRVPHLVHPHQTGRLTDTLGILCRLGVLPEGDWCWQVASVDAVCEHLTRRLREQVDGAELPPLTHVAYLPIDAGRLESALTSRGRHLQRLCLPALANTIAAAARSLDTRSDDRYARSLKSLEQLIHEHGVRAALCLSEPLLQSRQPLPGDPLELLLDRSVGC